MTISIQPLLTLPETRIRDETRIAAAIAAADSRYRKRTISIVLACVAQYGLGLSLIGWSLHIYGGDLAAAAFYGGMLVALCGPIWTVLLSIWLQENQ